MILTDAWDFTLSNYSTVWAALVQVMLLLGFLFLGNMLRRSIPFLRKAFIPSALIGGLLLLLVNVAFDQIMIAATGDGFKIVDQHTMQVITYHALGIGFVAMTLKTNKSGKKLSFLKVCQAGAIQGGAYMLQAILGIGCTVIMALCGLKAAGIDLFFDSGVILPLAFGQGPGNALAWDINFTSWRYSSSSIWNTNLVGSIADGASGNQLFFGNGSFGLSIASIGFIVASVVGVAYMNIMKRKGQIASKEAIVERKVEQFEGNNEIEDVESVDKFTIQAALVILAYALAFGIMCLFSLTTFTNMIAWGFNFIWGVLAATLLKLTLNFLRKKNVIHRNYVNNYQMDRISGFAFDLMIVAGVAAIDISDVSNYIIPIIVLCVLGTIGTYIYVRLIAKHCFKDIQHELFLLEFGTLTGTASNGMILLKEVDPNLETPTSNLFIVSELPATITVAPLLLLVNFSSHSMMNCLIALGIFIVLFVAYTLFIFLANKFKKKEVKQ